MYFRRAVAFALSKYENWSDIARLHVDHSTHRGRVIVRELRIRTRIRTRPEHAKREKARRLAAAKGREASATGCAHAHDAESSHRCQRRSYEVLDRHF
jgi:hypothetical protein